LKGFFSFIMTITVMVGLAMPNSALANKYVDTLTIFKKSEAVQPFFRNAYGYAVFPTVGKGGFGIGGAYGKGQVYRAGTVTGVVKLFKATIGFQLGGQAFSELIFFQDKRAYDEFTSGSFEFDAAASAVAITAGAQIKAGTEGATAGANVGSENSKQASTSYHKGMAVFIHTKGGLMYEAAIGGQAFSYNPR
jgi:lipid-binding SYLF domain-containing protein